MDVANSIVKVMLCFLSMISTNCNIIVDRMIGTPGHGKDVIDKINACDKKYLMGKCVWLVHQMLMTKNQEWMLIQW